LNRAPSSLSAGPPLSDNCTLASGNGGSCNTAAGSRERIVYRLARGPGRRQNAPQWHMKAVGTIRPGREVSTIPGRRWRLRQAPLLFGVPSLRSLTTVPPLSIQDCFLWNTYRNTVTLRLANK
jgi:hypothetical protein